MKRERIKKRKKEVESIVKEGKWKNENEEEGRKGKKEEVEMKEQERERKEGSNANNIWHQQKTVQTTAFAYLDPEWLETNKEQVTN